MMVGNPNPPAWLGACPLLAARFNAHNSAAPFCSSKMLSVFPTFYGTEAPVDSAQQTWEELRPPDHEYWRRVVELERAGGFWASARLAALHSEPGAEPLLAIALAPWRTLPFPELMVRGALDGTCWEGVPPHLSLCYGSECPGALLEAALRKWGRPRRVWVSCGRVTSGAVCELRTRGKMRGALASCALLRRMHSGGWYSHRPLHVSL